VYTHHRCYFFRSPAEKYAVPLSAVVVVVVVVDVRSFQQPLIAPILV
jgi:hypothetical protein